MERKRKTLTEHFVSEHMPEAWSRYEREQKRYLAGERADPPKLKIREHVTVEKFDGDKVEGQTPAEVAAFEDERSI